MGFAAHDWLQPGVVQDKVAQVEESSMDWDKQAFKEWCACGWRQCGLLSAMDALQVLEGV